MPVRLEAAVSRGLKAVGALAVGMAAMGCTGAARTIKVENCTDALFAGSAPIPASYMETTSQRFAAMGERPLCRYAQESRLSALYRVSVLPAFGRPRAMRLRRGEDGKWIASLSIAADSRSSKAPERREQVITGDAAGRIDRIVVQLDGLVAQPRQWVLGHDGEVWILEALTSDRGYAVVAAWSPRDVLESTLRNALKAVGDDCGDCTVPSS